MIIKINHPREAPLLVVTESMVGDSSIGAPVCDIDVLMEDGSYSSFFIRARVKDGRPSVEVATNRNNASVSKRVTGIKRKVD